jgi:hypothetical protein
MQIVVIALDMAGDRPTFTPHALSIKRDRLRFSREGLRFKRDRPIFITHAQSIECD